MTALTAELAPLVTELTDDNTAFHSENVEVRVRVVELSEQNAELAAALREVPGSTLVRSCDRVAGGERARCV